MIYTNDLLFEDELERKPTDLVKDMLRAKKSLADLTNKVQHDLKELLMELPASDIKVLRDLSKEFERIKKHKFGGVKGY